MLVSLTNAADAGHVGRELARRGLWVKRLENATGVHFFVGAHSAEVAQDDLRSIDGVADVAGGVMINVVAAFPGGVDDGLQVGMAHSFG